MTFYGRGWGHGVGMCQVGAYGMALDGATFEEILTKYYKGIELDEDVVTPRTAPENLLCSRAEIPL